MNLGIFATVFGVTFIAELPDKTALAALVLATKHKPLPVFLGAALALVVQSLIAVIAGSLLSKLPARPVQIGAALLFLGSAIAMWRRKEEDPKEDEASDKANADDKVGAAAKERDTFGKAFATVFGVVFVAEWGDLTQLTTAANAAKFGAPVLVFTAATLALVSVAGIAVFVGNRAGKLLDGKTTQRVAAVIFALVGIAMLAGWPHA